MERLRKLLAEVETEEDPDFDNGPEDVLEEIFSDHESFYEHDTESEEGGNSGNEDCVVLIWNKRTSERCDKPYEELGVIHQR
ncbi:hypothetical protein AVEN_101294-1 [Araneus ventricosus]|uniref:Uncharacterized protein n=1 Tax=Araneus ventricosus TaxID=182803 RepID=A0A4Y2ER14_ARAVE|nr:hypothetical protein AVEN_101294-1 [Araneus ventricosus]